MASCCQRGLGETETLFSKPETIILSHPPKTRQLLCPGIRTINKREALRILCPAHGHPSWPGHWASQEPWDKAQCVHDTSHIVLLSWPSALQALKMWFFFQLLLWFISVGHSGPTQFSFEKPFWSLPRSEGSSSGNLVSHRLQSLVSILSIFCMETNLNTQCTLGNCNVNS